jgi:hypothetical protein
VDNSRHRGAWVGAGFFAVLTLAELVLVAAADVSTLHNEGLDWRANHEQNTAAANGTALAIACMAGGALLAFLLTLIPRSSPPSTAGRALAVSAGAFLGGLAFFAYVIVSLWWTVAHSPPAF